MIPAENLSAFIQLVVKIDDCYCEQNKFEVCLVSMHCSSLNICLWKQT